MNKSSFAINQNTPVTDDVLNLIAHLPTEHLSKLVAPEFFKLLKDDDFMRIGTLLAQICPFLKIHAA